MPSTNISDLPEECLSHILSLTSPIDVIRSSTLSKPFLRASESDIVWNKFLPSDLGEIVSQSSTPFLVHQFGSKKDLYLHLCSNYVLFKDDTQSFGLNKRNGKKWYMLGARALTIIWGNTPHYWDWKHVPESRFPETAELLDVCWLLIEANVNRKILSRNTTYGAYLVFKMNDDNLSGFERTQVNTYVFEVPKEDESSGLPPPQSVPFKSLYLKAQGSLRSPREDLPYPRDDGWMEIEMGRYYVNDDIDESVMLRMTLTEVEALNWKSGLIVQGIELRPLD